MKLVPLSASCYNSGSRFDSRQSTSRGRLDSAIRERSQRFFPVDDWNQETEDIELS